MATLPPSISGSGGTKKPFSYIPGGIDFSELKSPKMARRIAKHQAGISEPVQVSPAPGPAVFTRSLQAAQAPRPGPPTRQASQPGPPTRQASQPGHTAQREACSLGRLAPGSGRTSSPTSNP